MQLSDFVQLCQNYRDLGWAVQEQLGDALEGDHKGINLNAWKMIKEWLRDSTQTLCDPELREEVDDLVEDVEK